MRVRVAYTVTVDDEYRRAIKLYHGAPGLATRREVAAWMAMHGASLDDDLARLLEDEAEAA